MNKRTSRLIAMLLTAIMLFNIAPTAAFAEGSEEIQSPGLIVDDSSGFPEAAQLSEGPVPGGTQSEFTVRYVIRGEYTYNQKDLVYDSFTVYNADPSTYPVKSITGANVDGNNRTWSDGVLTFYVVPNTCTVELRYMLIFEDANGNLDVRTFQQIGNHEAGLGQNEQGEFETLEFKHFNGDSDNIILQQYNGVDIKQILPFTVPTSYIERNEIVETSWGREYKIEYYGHNAGVDNWQNTQLGDIIQSETIPWTYGQSQISLYFRVKAADDTSGYYTVSFVNYDGTELYKIKVKEGYTPVYGGNNPTRPSDGGTSYSFSGWDREIVPVTEDTVYTAQYTEDTDATPPTRGGGTETGNVTFTIRLVLADTGVTRYFYHTTIRLSGRGTNENGQYDYYSNVVSNNNIELNIDHPDDYLDKNTNGNDFPAGRKYLFTISAHNISVGLVTVENADLLSSAVPIAATQSGDFEIAANQAGNIVITIYELGTGPSVDTKYTVTFVDDDGTVLKEATEYTEGTAAADIAKPADPAKDATPEFTYTFAGWSPEIADVTADATYTATYTETKNQYNVTFVDYDGTELKAAAAYDYGTAAADIVKPADPTRDATPEFTYTFAGWSPEIADVTADATYTATYTGTKNQYSYTIHHYLLGTTTPVRKDQSGTVNYGTVIEVEFAGKYLNRDLRYDPNEAVQTLTVTEGDNTVTIFYTLPLTIAANENGKTYGDPEPELSATVTGALENDKVTFRVTRAAGENAGTYTISVGNIAAAGYYTIESVTDADFIISKAALTVTADDKTQVYGEEAKALTWTADGLANGDTKDAVPVAIEREDGDDAGTYVITPGGAAETDNYIVTYVPGTYTISLRPVTVTITGNKDSKVYNKTEQSVEGYGVSISDPLYTAADFSISGSAAASGTAAGKYPMNLSESRFTNNNTNFDVTFSVTDGELEITKRAVTVTVKGNKESRTYTGREQKTEGYSLSISDPLYTAADFTFSGEAAASGTTAGTYPMGLDESRFTNNNNNNFDVTFSVTDGSLEITRAALTVTAEGKTKEYGDADPELTWSVSGLQGSDTREALAVSVSRAEGENAGTYTITPSGKAVQGSYSVTYATGTLEITRATATVTADSKSKTYGDPDPELTAQVTGLKKAADTVTFTVKRDSGETAGTYDIIPEGDLIQGNYNVTYENGELTIGRARVTVKADDKGKTYDGKIFEPLTATVTGLKNGETETVISYSLGGNSSADAGTYTIKPSGAAEQGNYEVTYENGTLTIGKRAMTLTSGSAEREYNGSPLTNSEITGENFAEGEGAAYTVTGSQTLPGNSRNGFTYKLNKGTKASNYDITLAYGTLNVLNREAKYEITVRANSLNAGTYDGTKKTVSGLESTSFEVEGHTYTVEGLSASAEGTNAGSYPVNVEGTAIVKDADGNDVTGQFAVHTEAGTLTIGRKAVTVTAADKTKVYGGADPELTVTVSGLVEGENESLIIRTVSRESGEEVGTYAITVSGAAEQGNYSVSYTDGTLEITQATATVTAAGQTKTYGDADPAPEAAVTGLVNGDEASVITYTLSRAAGEQVGSYAITPAGAENQGNYKVVYVPATLTITPASVTVSAENKSKVYGDAEPELTWTAAGLKNGESRDVLAVSISRATGEAVGTYAITASGDAEQGNYNVTYAPGVMTITRATVTVTAEDKSKVYGDADPELTWTAAGLKNGDSKSVLSVTLSRAEGESTGNYAIVPAGAAEQGNYNVTYANGTMSITPAQLTVTAEDKSKAYGDADPSLTATVSGLKNNDNKDVAVYTLGRAEGEDAGTYAITPSGAAAQGNYTVRYVPATLTITRAKATVTAADRSKAYGDADPELTWTVEGLKNNDGKSVFTVSLSRAEGQDAGTYTITPSGAAEQGNYEVTYENGTLTIGKRAMTLTSGSAEREYNGSPLTSSEITGENFAEGEGAAYTVTGSQTLPGSSRNTFTYQLNEGTKAGNYDITPAYGTLNVINREAKYEITVTANSLDAGTYDGTKKTVSGLEATEFELDGHTYTVEGLSASAEGTNAGSYPVNVEGTPVVKDADGNDVTEQFAVHTAAGTLAIGRKAVTVTAADKTKVYGDADPGFTATVSGTLNGDKVEYTISRAEGENTGEYAITPDGGKEQGNYAVTYQAGKLTVTPAKVTVTADDKTKVYGQADPELTWTAEGLKNGDKAAVLSIGATREATGNNDDIESVGTHPISLTGDETQGNYTVRLVPGTMTITRATLTVTADDKTKVYGDGDPTLTATVSGLQNGDGESVISYSLSRAAGDGVGSYAITPDGDKVIDNYNVVYVPGALTVTRKTVTVAADDKRRTNRMNETDPQLTATVTGLVDGEPESLISYTLTREGDNSVGDHPIIASGEADQGNYHVEFVPGTMTIEDVKDTLYNLAKINGKWYRLKKQENGIRTEKTLEEYVSHIVKDGYETTLVYNRDYDYLVDYDFTGTSFTIDQITYVYYDGESEIDPNTDYFTVDGIEKICVARKKIGGLTGWLIPEGEDRYTEPNATDCFKRNFLISLHSAPANQELYSMVKVGNKYYRLHKGTIFARDISKYEDGKAIPKSHYTLVPGDHTLEDGTYDFTNVEIRIGDITYKYSDQVYDGLDYYYTVKFDKVTRESRFHSDPDWYTNELGWLDNSQADYPDTNDYLAFHANYNATLHNPTYQAAKLVAVSGTATYDGKGHTISGYKVYVNGTLRSDITFDGVGATVTGRNAGTYACEITGATAYETLDASGKFMVTEIVDGELEIRQKAVTVTANEKTKVYDNDATTDPALDAEVTGAVDGETINYTLSRKAGQDAGDYAITVTAGKNPNYKVTVEGSTFHITQRAVTVTANEKTKVYDNDAATDPKLDAEVTGAVDGVAVNYTLSRAAGQDAGDYAITVTAGENPNYKVTVAGSTFHITQRAVTVTANEKTKVYDNDATTDPELDAEVTGAVDGVAVNYTLSRKAGQDVGNYAITVTAGENLNYKVTVEGSTFHITQRAVTVTANEKTKVYDNDAATDPKLDAEVTGAVAGVAVNYTLSREEGQDAGDYAITVTPGENPNYEVTVEGSTFHITKRAVTVRANGKAKVYDNDPATDPALDAEVTGAVDGVAVSYTLSREEGQDAGDYAITVTAGENPNYEVTVEGNTFQITKKDVTVKANEKTKTYDNDPATDPRLDAEVMGAVDGVAVSYTLSREEGQDAGDYAITVTAGENPNYEVTVEGSTFHITKKPVIIRANEKTKVYDNDETTDPALDADVIGAVDGVAVSYTLSREEGQDAGDYAITVTAGVNPNYEVTAEDSTFHITKKPVTISANEKTKVYDNDASTDPELDAEVTGTVDGVAVSYTLSREEGQDAGDYAITVTAGENPNYEVTVEDSTFHITKKAATIRANEKTKVYDNDASTDPELDAEVEGAVGGDVIHYTLDREEGQKAGDYEIYVFEGDNPNYEVNVEHSVFHITKRPVTIRANEKAKVYDNDYSTDPVLDAVMEGPVDGDPVTFTIDRQQGQDAGDYVIYITVGEYPNYEMTVEDSAFHITKRPVTIRANEKTKAYDNNEATDPALDAAVEGAVDGDTISYTLSREAGQAAGDYAISVTAGENPNYDVSVEGSTFHITPLAGVVVTITGHNGRYTYNASVRKVSGYDTGISNPLYTEADFSFNGTASAAGTDAGTYAMGLKPEYFTNNNANFTDVTFVTEDGALVIDPKEVTVTANESGKTYGDADPALTATTEGLEGNDYIAVRLTRGTGEDIGTYPISVRAAANPNYVIRTVPGSFTIGPRPVTVTADSKLKVFGSTDPALTAFITGLAADESAELIRYTLSREPGETIGDYAITASGEAEQGNYTVTYVPAVLTIAPEDIVVVTITGNSGTFKYDGQEKDLSGYDVEISNEQYTEDDFIFSGSSDLKAVNAGTYRTGMKPEDFANINDNFPNVVFVVNNGQLEITRRNVTLTSASDSKPYDGTALVNERVDISEEGFAEGEGVNVTVTGRIVTEGSEPNTFTYTMEAGTLEQNYRIRTVYGTLTITQGEKHRLTITYVDEKGEVLRVFTREYAFGESYSVASGTIAGYRPDITTVTGTMGGEDVEVTVTYWQSTYTLTVKYVSITDGSEVADPVVMQLKKGDTYTVFTPAVSGYTALQSEVSGVMPDTSRKITVFMVPDDDSEFGASHRQIEIEDYGTPLGVPESILGGGEVIE